MSGHICAVPRCGGDDGSFDQRTDPAGVCELCARRGRAALREYPWAFAALHLELAPRYSSLGGERVSGSAAPAAPMRLHTADVIRDLTAAVLGWEDAARRSLGLSPPSRYSTEHQLTRAVRTLTRQYERLLPLDGGPRFVGSLLHTRAVYRRVLGWTTLVHHLPAPCPACDTLDLHRRDGEDYVRCHTCGAWWDEHEYGRLVHILAAEYSR